MWIKCRHGAFLQQEAFDGGERIMIRRNRKSEPARGNTMSREDNLRTLGVILNGNTGALASATPQANRLADSVFSGYGSYRPITVRSYSMPDNAHLERSQ